MADKRVYIFIIPQICKKVKFLAQAAAAVNVKNRTPGWRPNRVSMRGLKIYYMRSQKILHKFSKNITWVLKIYYLDSQKILLLSNNKELKRRADLIPRSYNK